MLIKKSDDDDDYDIGFKKSTASEANKRICTCYKEKKKGTAMRTDLNCTPTTDTMELNENTTTSRTFFYSDVP